MALGAEPFERSLVLMYASTPTIVLEFSPSLFTILYQRLRARQDAWVDRAISSPDLSLRFSAGPLALRLAWEPQQARRKSCTLQELMGLAFLRDYLGE